MPRKRCGSDVNEVPTKTLRRIPPHIEHILNRPTVQYCCHELMAYAILDYVVKDHQSMMQNHHKLFDSLIQSMQLAYEYVQIISFDIMDAYLNLNEDERQIFIDGFYQKCEKHFCKFNSAHLIIKKETGQLEDVMCASAKLWLKRKGEMQLKQQQQMQQAQPLTSVRPNLPILSAQQIPNTRQIQMPFINNGVSCQTPALFQQLTGINNNTFQSSGMPTPPPPYTSNPNNPQVIGNILNSNLGGNVNISLTQQTVNMGLNPGQSNLSPHSPVPKQLAGSNTNLNTQPSTYNVNASQLQRQAHIYRLQQQRQQQIQQQQQQPQRQSNQFGRSPEHQSSETSSMQHQQQKVPPVKLNIPVNQLEMSNQNQSNAFFTSNTMVNNIVTNSFTSNPSAPNAVICTNTVSNELTNSGSGSNDEPEFISDTFCATQSQLGDHLQPYLEIFKQDTNGNAIEVTLPTNDLSIESAVSVASAPNAKNIMQRRKSFAAGHESNVQAIQRQPTHRVQTNGTFIPLNPSLDTTKQILVQNNNQQNIAGNTSSFKQLAARRKSISGFPSIPSPGQYIAANSPSTTIHWRNQANGSKNAGAGRCNPTQNIFNSVTQRILTPSNQQQSASKSINTQTSIESHIKNISPSLNNNVSMTQSGAQSQHPQNDSSSFKKIAARRKSIAVLSIPQLNLNSQDAADTGNFNSKNTNQTAKNASFKRIAKRRQSIAACAMPSMPSMPSLSPPPPLLSPITPSSELFNISYAAPTIENNPNKTQPIVNVILNFDDTANKQNPTSTKQNTLMVKIPKADLPEEIDKIIDKFDNNIKPNLNQNILQSDQLSNVIANKNEVKLLTNTPNDAQQSVATTSRSPIITSNEHIRAFIIKKNTITENSKTQSYEVKEKSESPKITDCDQNVKASNDVVVKTNDSSSEISKSPQSSINIQNSSNENNSKDRNPNENKSNSTAETLLPAKTQQNLNSMSTAKQSSQSKHVNLESNVNAKKLVAENLSEVKHTQSSSSPKNESTVQTAPKSKEPAQKTVSNFKMCSQNKASSGDFKSNKAVVSTSPSKSNENTKNTPPNIQEIARLMESKEQNDLKKDNKLSSDQNSAGPSAQESKSSFVHPTQKNVATKESTLNDITQIKLGIPVKTGQSSNVKQCIDKPNQNAAVGNMSSPHNDPQKRNLSVVMKAEGLSNASLLRQKTSTLSSQANHNKAITMKSPASSRSQRMDSVLPAVKTLPSRNASASSRASSALASSASTSSAGSTSSKSTSSASISSPSTSSAPSSLASIVPMSSPSKIVSKQLNKPEPIASNETIELSDDDDDCQIIEDAPIEIISIDCDPPSLNWELQRCESPVKLNDNKNIMMEKVVDQNSNSMNDISVTVTKTNTKSAMDFEFYCIECYCRAFRICKSCHCVSYCSLECEQKNDAHAGCLNPDIVNLIDYEFIDN